MTDKLTQTGSQASQELSRTLCQEQIICKYKFQDKEKFGGKPYCTCFSELCEDLPPCDDNCQIYEDYKQLTSKIQEYEELKIENEELNNRMAEVTYRATGGRLSYSNYTLDAIEQAFNDQLEILSDQKVEEETKELKEENEKLKKKFQALHLINVQSLVKQVNRYNEALEKIENILASTSGKMRPNLYDYEQDAQILDIISKAKEKTNE